MEVVFCVWLLLWFAKHAVFSVVIYEFCDIRFVHNTFDVNDVIEDAVDVAVVGISSTILLWFAGERKNKSDAIAFKIVEHSEIEECSIAFEWNVTATCICSGCLAHVVLIMSSIYVCYNILLLY